MADKDSNLPDSVAKYKSACLNSTKVGSLVETDLQSGDWKVPRGSG